MSKFSDLNLSGKTLKTLEKMGFDEATPIQSMTIPAILDGKDVIGQAQTGTGKTFAYALPAIESLKGENLQILVLCPTRELAIQVADEFRKIADPEKVVAVYGGQEIVYQIKALRKGPQIVVGTPGRILDHIRRKTLKLVNVKMVVIDEADDMLDMGFIEDIETILNETSSERQTVLFSATMPKPIIDLTKKFQRSPEFIKAPSKELTVENIEQHYFLVKENDKSELLFRLFDIYDPQSAMIFCNTKKGVDDLVTVLKENHYSVDAIHGDIRQSQRDKVMNTFKSRNTKILVATDVAARGLDIKNVEMVINYDLPNYNEYYIHRIGRTGRMGKSGLSFTFVTGREVYKLHEIERYARTKIEKLEIPSIEEIEDKSQSVLVNRVKVELMDENYKMYLKKAKALLEEFLDIDVIAALLKISEKNFRKREFRAIEKIREFSNDSRQNNSRKYSKFSKGENKPYRKTARTHSK
ncbi:MAG: DEAD/DEAH box helicase [Thermotogae bacterium]|jgi:ATP-dependent RNA helicase DeaD|nr:DEAD/DEAH box helicase [Thermotogota bacterium]